MIRCNGDNKSDVHHGMEKSQLATSWLVSMTTCSMQYLLNSIDSTQISLHRTNCTPTSYWTTTLLSFCQAPPSKKELSKLQMLNARWLHQYSTTIRLICFALCLWIVVVSTADLGIFLELGRGMMVHFNQTVKILRLVVWPASFAQGSGTNYFGQCILRLPCGGSWCFSDCGEHRRCFWLLQWTCKVSMGITPGDWEVVWHQEVYNHKMRGLLFFCS